MKKTWRNVVGHEGIYMVSNHGKIKRIKQGTNTFVGRILNPGGSNKYLRVILCNAGKRHMFTIHVIVCTAFHGPKPLGCEVNHKDLDKWNNTSNNLEWVTPQENAKHYVLRSGKSNYTLRKEYVFTSPTGKTYRVLGLREFCKNMSLSLRAMGYVANGHYKYHKGWKCKHARRPRVRL